MGKVRTADTLSRTSRLRICPSKASTPSSVVEIDFPRCELGSDDGSFHRRDSLRSLSYHEEGEKGEGVLSLITTGGIVYLFIMDMIACGRFLFV
jgi:hypothetical protein